MNSTELKATPRSRRIQWEVTRSGCWECTSHAKNSSGRPIVKHNGSYKYASRVVWTLLFGDPGKLFVLHSCDNGSCINPAHLRLGNHIENMADARNRNRHICGVEHHGAKLDPKKVRDIRKMLDAGASLQSVASKYKVTKQAIDLIKKRKTWKQVQ